MKRGFQSISLNANMSKLKFNAWSRTKKLKQNIQQNCKKLRIQNPIGILIPEYLANLATLFINIFEHKSKQQTAQTNRISFSSCKP